MDWFLAAGHMRKTGEKFLYYLYPNVHKIMNVLIIYLFIYLFYTHILNGKLYVYKLLKLISTNENSIKEDNASTPI